MYAKDLFVIALLIVRLEVLYASGDVDPVTTITQQKRSRLPALRRTIDSIREAFDVKYRFLGNTVPYSAECKKTWNVDGLVFPKVKKDESHYVQNVSQKTYLCKDPDKNKRSFYMLQTTYTEKHKTDPHSKYVTTRTVLYYKHTNEEIGPKR